MRLDGSLNQLCVAVVLAGVIWTQPGFGQQAGTGSQPAPAGAVRAVGLKVGVAKAAITPPLTETDRPVWLAGFDTGRRATGVHDDLYARALFLDSGKQRVAIVALDFVGYDYTQALACRELLKTRQPELADVHLLIASTHNHEGPDTMGPWGPLPMVSGVDRAYLDQVRERIVEVVGAAVSGAVWARMRFAEAPTQGLIGDSRPPKVINETIHALHAERADNGQPIGSLLLWHSHPEDLGSKNTLITADFPKYAIEEMEASLGGTTVYLSGTVGGLLSSSHVRLTDERTGAEILRRTFAHAGQIGRRAARVAVAAIQQAKPLSVERLDLKVKELDLPLGNPAYRVGLALRSMTPRPLYTKGKPDPRTELLAERVQRDPMLRAWMDQAKERLGVAVSLLQQLALPIGEDIRTELNVITLGPAQFITIPGELYPALAIGGIPSPPDLAVDFPDAPPEPALTKFMQGQYKFIIGLGNDELGYLLPKSQWDVQAPYAYGDTKPPYGEVFSPGPDAALRIAEAYRELLAGQENLRVKPLDEPASGESWVNPPQDAIAGVEHRVFQSASMQRAVGFNLYLPPGYAGSDKRFPVVYYLHGMTDCESTHPQLFAILDKAIRAGEVPPMILVYAMCGRTSFYADSPDGEVMGETVFIKELIPHVDRTVRTVAARDSRAVMGFSMGGAGTVKFASKYPDLFGSAVSFSGGFTTGEFEKPRHPAVFKKMFGSDVKRFDEQSALTLARTGGGKVPLRLVVGTKDKLLEHNRRMKAVFEDLKSGFEYEEIAGVGHNPPLVFEAQGLKAFQFHARHFRP